MSHCPIPYLESRPPAPGPGGSSGSASSQLFRSAWLQVCAWVVGSTPAKKMPSQANQALRLGTFDHDTFRFGRTPMMHSVAKTSEDFHPLTITLLATANRQRPSLRIQAGLRAWVIHETRATSRLMPWTLCSAVTWAPACVFIPDTVAPSATLLATSTCKSLAPTWHEPLNAFNCGYHGASAGQAASISDLRP